MKKNIVIFGLTLAFVVLASSCKSTQAGCGLTSDANTNFTKNSEVVAVVK